MDDGGLQASQSIRATINELTRYLDGDDHLRHGERRAELNEKLADYAQWWFKEGFALGHKACQKRLRQNGNIDHVEARANNVWIAPNLSRSIKLSSTEPGHPDPAWKY